MIHAMLIAYKNININYIATNNTDFRKEILVMISDTSKVQMKKTTTENWTLLFVLSLSIRRRNCFRTPLGTKSMTYVHYII